MDKRSNVSPFLFLMFELRWTMIHNGILYIYCKRIHGSSNNIIYALARRIFNQWIKWYVTKINKKIVRCYPKWKVAHLGKYQIPLFGPFWGLPSFLKKVQGKRHGPTKSSFLGINFSGYSIFFSNLLPVNINRFMVMLPN